jgi:hypothetical protein
MGRLNSWKLDFSATKLINEIMYTVILVYSERVGAVKTVHYKGYSL